MATPTPIAKVSIGKSGHGAAHVSYITRLSDLDPAARERANGLEKQPDQASLFTDGERGRQETSVLETIEENLNERAFCQTREHPAADQSQVDPVWTWNAPQFLTGEAYGTNPELNPPEARGVDKASTVRDKKEQLTLKEKVQNVKDYFASLEDYERRKGGRTHYRLILSFDVPATNEQIRDLTNKFLEQTFPKAIAFGAIHRDTDHPHVHLYLNSRQFDGKRIQLKNSEFKTIDEKWATTYAQFAGDKSIYVEHLKKKEETKQWKIAAAEAYRKGEPIPPKPERDNDRRERLAEQRLSAARSQERDKGKQLDPRPLGEPVSRPASEKETSRLLAKHEVAREQLAHLIRIDAPAGEVKSVARITQEFAAALDKTLASRNELGRENLPAVVYTTEEWKLLKEYSASKTVPLKDDHAAARLQAGRVLAGAELKDTQCKADAFRASRHFWRFEIEGWERGLSLKEVEQDLKTKAEERVKLYNFLRPGKRETIQGQIDYLQGVKNDVQKQLAAREISINKDLGAAEITYQIATKQVEHTEKGRAAQGKAMPLPIHQKDELARMDDIANRHTDAPLLRYVYDQVKDKLLANPTPEALSRVKGCSVMARLDAKKASQQLEATRRFGDFRQLPLKDARGLDYAKSIREVSPRNALETIIRHFTDSSEQTRERKGLTEAARQQLARAEDQSTKARDFSSVVDKILGDHCRAARVLPGQVGPKLNSQQIAELREFADKLPFLSAGRKEFSEAARQAEQRLQERETVAAVRESERILSQHRVVRPEGQSPGQAATLPDRDTSSRGR